jgi:hypothetical protein
MEATKKKHKVAYVEADKLRSTANELRELADRHDKDAQQARWKNDEKSAQYYSGLAQGYRNSALEIDRIAC